MKERTIIAWLFRKIRRRIPMMIGMILANVGSAVSGVLFALGTREVINSAVAGSQDLFVRACITQLAIIVFMLSCIVLSHYLRDRMLERLDMDRKRELLHAILHGDYEKVSTYHSGELVNRMNNDVRTLNEGVVSLLPGLVSMVVRLVAAVSVLFALEPLFTVLLAAGGLAAVVVTGLFRRWLKQLHKDVSGAEGRVLSFLQEAAERLLIIQAMDIPAEVERRADALLEDRLHKQRKRRRMSLTANTGVSILYHAAGFVALVWCARGLLLNTMTFGTMSVITQLVSQLQAPFVNLSGILPRYAAMTAAAERLMELEECCCSGACEQVYDAIDLKFDAIAARDLSFGYDDEPVFEGAQFRIPAGSFAVVTGSSGIGKSTLLKLALGIFRPGNGQLYVEHGGHKMTLSRGTRSLFSYVPQGNFLFSGSVLDNLLIARPEATPEEIEQALHISAADEFIHELPRGLDTLLAERGEGLSEGQVQRLAVARAVLSGAPVLLLDEATSALDSDTERTVLERLAARKDRTCIAVTHRPAALELAQVQLDIHDKTIVQTQLF